MWSFLILPALGASPDTVAVDRAYEALAAGDPSRAVSELRAGLARTADDAARARVLCALGAALLADDRPAEAEQALAKVPLAASCGPRAAFLRADAIARQGRAPEAAALYEQVGAPFLGDDAHAVSADAVVALAEKLLADPDRGRATATGLLQATLGFELSTEHAAQIARTLAAAVEGEDAAACSALLASLAAHDDPADRHLAAKVCSRDDALPVIAGLPDDDPEKAWLLARFARGEAANELRLRALTPDRQLEVAEALGADLRAADLYAADPSADALARLAELRVQQGDLRAAEARLSDHLARFPTDPHHADVAARHAEVLQRSARQRYASGDREGALADLDALVSLHPADPHAGEAALEAGYVLRALGRRDEARKRWDEVVARYPDQAEAALSALARQQAFDDGDVAGALDRLRRAQADWGGGASELARWKAVDLWASARGRVAEDPVVRVGVRNVDEIEVSVHRIDLEALVRGGRGPFDLDELDVAAIAPEVSYTVPVPGYAQYRDLAFDVPVRVSRPGMYAVTVSGEDHEARVMVLVSDLTLAARRVGPDVAVATFDGDGDPVGGARVLAIVGGAPTEGRTDGGGVWVARGLDASDGVVLAERSGSWAIAELPSDDFRAATVAEVRAELDRSVVLPGDTVGVRVVARTPSGEPAAGEWTLWLEGNNVETAPVRVRADALGVAVADLPVPPMDGAVTWTVTAIAPGEPMTRSLGSVVSVAADPSARSVVARGDGRDVVLTVRGAQGEPLAGVPITWEDGGGRTDARGEIRVQGPPETLPWRFDWQTADGTVGGWTRPVDRDAEPVLHAASEQLRPGEAPRVGLELRRGDERAVGGSATVSLFALRVPAEAAGPVPDPWSERPDPDGLEGPLDWEGDAPAAPSGVQERLWTGTVPVEAGKVAPVPLPALEPGRYVLTASVGTESVARTLEVSADGPRWVGLADPGRFVDELHLGDRLDVGVDGGPALMVAGDDHVLWASTRREAVAVDDTWGTAVTWTATTPSGRVAVHHTAVDPMLAVEVRASAGDVTVEVHTAHGEPVMDAQIAVTAVDPRVADVWGAPQALGDARTAGAALGGGALGADLRDGAVGVEVSAELLAEADWEEEAERVERGLDDGILSDNRLSDALLGEVPLSEIGGIGSGGGGYGSGYGSGGLGADSVVYGELKRASSSSTPGVRERVLWAQLRTDKAGRASVRWTGPPAAYVVRATAIHRRGEGTGTAELDTATAPRLLVAAPPPGRPDDRAVPRVTIVNPTGVPLAGVVSVGAAEAVVEVPPGAATTVDVGDALPPGAAEVRFAVDGGPTWSAPWRFDLDPGQNAVDGPLYVTAGGPNPSAHIALRRDPRAASEPWRDAVRGRAALAAHRIAPSPALARVVRDTAATLDSVYDWPNATWGASALLFLAEARDQGLVTATPSELRAFAEQIPAPVTPDERGWLVRARTVAGLPVDGTLVALVRSEPPTPALVAARMALGDDPPEGVYGLDVSAAMRAVEHPLYRREPLLYVGPPDPGDPLLPEWIAAVGALPAGGPDALAVTTTAPTVGGYTWNAMPWEAGEAPLAVAVVPAEVEDVVVEGAPCDPCALAVGDWLLGPLDDAAPAGLLRRSLPTQRVGLQAVAPGTFTVVGRDEDGRPTRPVVVTVGERGPVGADAAVALAERAVDVREAPALPAGDLAGDLARRAARVRFDDALIRGDDAAVASTFRALAATDPGASVPLSDVARAARALSATADADGAVRVWKAGLDAAFAREAAVLGDLEGAGGPLVAIQKVREAAARYPDGPLVAESAYLLPARLHDLADGGLPAEVQGAGIRASDVELTAAAWDREFLGTYPRHPLATAAGLRLARTLLGLGAPAQASAWSERIRRAHPDGTLLDGLVLLEALAATEAGDAGRADRLLRELVSRPWPDDGGSLGPSAHTADAWLAIGRIREAQGDRDGALAAYASAGTEAAARQQAALERSTLTVPGVVRGGAGEGLRLEIASTNVDEVRIRAYPVDLRTVFLRDGGLASVSDIAVAGVSPAWTGARRLGTGAFPEVRAVDLPLSGAGAWVVQVEGGPGSASALVVRSGLALAVVDEGGERRVIVRRGGRPAGGVEIRALGGGGVQRAETDVRGVVNVPSGAPVLAWSGPDWAFTDPEEERPIDGGWDAPAPMGDPLLEGLDERVRDRRALDRQKYDAQFGEASDELGLSTL